MVKILRRFIFKYCFPLFSLTLAAFPLKGFCQAKFSTNVSEKQPDITEYIQVEYTVENAKSVDKINSPVFKNFRIIQGPSQSTGMTYMNGVLSQSKSISFIVQPLSVGKQQVPGTEAIVDGKMMESSPVAIEVVKSGKKNHLPLKPFPGFSPDWPDLEPASVDEEYLLKPGESFQQKIKNNLFVKADVNKTTCYEGEPIVATFTLSSRLKSESRVTKRPSLNGFSVYDMVDPETSTSSVQNINGKPFNVHLIRKTQLFPLQAGTFVIDPVELENTVRFVKAAAPRSPARTNMEQLMEDLMNEGRGGETEEHNLVLASKPVTITVKPLPLAGKPAGFNGAVGNFTIDQHWKNKTVAAGDALEMEFTVKGAGNFSVINAPAIDLPPSIDTYDPTIKEDVDKGQYPLKGSKVFDYTFIPRDTGHFVIPAVSFSYFDPSEEKYKTINSQPAEIVVTRGSRKHESGNVFTKSEAATSSFDFSGFFDEYRFVIFAGLALLALTGVGIYKQQQKKRRRRRKSRSRSSTLASQAVVVSPAPSAAPVDPFADSKTALAGGDAKAFYAQVNRSLWKFVSDKLSIPSTELNKYNVAASLKIKGVDEETISNLQQLLGECEVALYTPVHDEADMTNTLSKAESILASLKSTID